MMMMTVQIFWKYRGHDHFVFFSITINQMVGIGVKVFFMEICQNCTGTVLPCIGFLAVDD